MSYKIVVLFITTAARTSNPRSDLLLKSENTGIAVL
jgi:hypothetical protein